MAQVLVRQSLMSHRRTMRLAKLLGEDRYAAAGRIIALWLWALDNAPEGVLESDFGDYAADVLGYSGESGSVLRALIAAGWIVDTSELGDDDEDASLVIANWGEEDGPISRWTENNPNK